MSKPKNQAELILACNLSAFSPEQRESHIALSRELFASVSEMRELPNGYAFRVANEAQTLFKLADFIKDERLCCSFFEFGIEVTAQRGPIWLKLSGLDPVKQFVLAELGQLLNENVVTVPNSVAEELEDFDLACDLSALSDKQREHHISLAHKLFGLVSEVHELANGYAFRLAGESQLLIQIADFINDERLCCSFINFSLEVEAQHGFFCLSITGGDGVKEFVLAETTPLLNEAVITIEVLDEK